MCGPREMAELAWLLTSSPRILLPGPGEAGPHVPLSGSRKGRCTPAVEDLSSFDAAHVGFRFLEPQEPWSSGYSVAPGRSRYPSGW